MSLSFHEFVDLINWVKTHTDATEDEAGDIAVEIGDTPVYDDDGNWIATVDGKKWTIPAQFPMPESDEE